MKEEYSKIIDPVEDRIRIESVKVDLRKCGVNGVSGIPNIYGRRVQKYLVFPVAKINYFGDAKVECNKYNRTVDIKDAALTNTNYEGVGCGMTYFVVSNGKLYSLYDINGRFIKYIPIAVYGKIICLGAQAFVTLSENGILHLWSNTGICSDDIIATPENMKRYGWQKGKLIKKAESFSQCEVNNDGSYL